MSLCGFRSREFRFVQLVKETVRLTFDAPAFLALYTGGALAHKNIAMQKGGERKAAVEAATTLGEVEAA